MLFVELGGSFLIKLEQLQIAYRELLLSRSDHLAEIEISIRLQHAVGPS